MSEHLSRRRFLMNVSLAGTALLTDPSWSQTAPKSPNDKLNIACIGVGGQGAADLEAVSSQNIVAMCDVDDARAAASFKAYPNARKYRDYRKMLDEGKDIEAVVVTIPDHSHASAAVMAMKLGKHVYCQKPLAHSIAEARVMLDTSRKQKVVTQMGIQGHPSYVRAVELIQTGAIGPVREVHVITDRPHGWWPQGMTTPPANTGPAPATLDWDLWLGPAAKRDYSAAYLPFIWRGWWDFGTGALGDMGCHLMDAPFWALKLRAPTSVEATSTPVSAVSPPLASVIKYQFPAREDMPPVVVTWYDGGNRPPTDALEGQKLDPTFNGSLFVGDKGKLLAPHGGDPKLLPEAQFVDFKPPAPFLPRSPGHYLEWIEACKTGGPTGASFEYSVPLTETVLLGNVALRTGQPIQWDARRLRATNCPAAHQFVHYKYRTGWRL